MSIILNVKEVPKKVFKKKQVCETVDTSLSTLLSETNYAEKDNEVCTMNSILPSCSGSGSGSGSGSIVKKKIVKRKKLSEESDEIQEEQIPLTTKQISKEKEKEKEQDCFPKEGPHIVTILPEHFYVLKAFFIPNHRYVGLQNHQNVYRPFFFIVLQPWSSDNTLLCQAVVHINSYEKMEEDDKDEKEEKEDKEHQVQTKPKQLISTPKWNVPWSQITLTHEHIWNCVPFDENRIYYYTETCLVKKEI